MGSYPVSREDLGAGRELVRLALNPGFTDSPRGFALYNAANLKSIDYHRKAEEKSLAQLKRQ